MTKDEALKLALEALDCIYSPLHVREINKVGAAMTAIREALAQPDQEPVAWAESYKDGDIAWHKELCFSDDPEWLDNPIPLYTTPPQRNPLTDEEIDVVYSGATGQSLRPQDKPLAYKFARAVETKLQERT